MTTARDVRAHRVRLRAVDPSAVGRGVTLLTDALRTASFPWPDGGRLIVVRRLQVGRFETRRAPAPLALAIEAALRRIAADAVVAHDPAAATADAVVFADAIEPLIALARRAARGDDLSAWFWTAAVPRWRPGLEPVATFRLLLDNALGSDAGTAAALSLLKELHANRVLVPYLDSLGAEDGPFLLRAFGWSGPLDDATPPHLAARPLPGPPADWSLLLEREVARWSGDARAIWLAAVALSVASPARLLDSRLPAQAVQLVRAVNLSDRVPHEEEHDHTTDGRSRPPTTDGPGPRGDARPEERPGPVTPVSPGDTASAHAGSLPDSVSQAPKPEVDRTGEPLAPADEPLRPSPGASAAEERRAVWVRDPFDAEPTAHAGLWFLIPALEHLGIADFLQAHPDAAANDWPRQLLHAVGSRLGIGEPDAARRSLGESGVSTVWEPDGFAAPTRWIGAITTRGEWQVGRAEGGRVLSDRSGRLPIAAWKGPAPGSVRALVAGRSLGRVRRAGYGGPSPWPIRALVDHAWAVALRRWVRLYARQGIAELTGRPGRIAWSRTHVDVIMTLEEADIRVRRPGLDLDPGWVAWLARVVRFHYVRGG